MRTLIMGLAVTAVMLAAGCIPSIHAIYTDNTKVVAPDLEGVWVSNDANETWQFTLFTEDKEYELVFTDAEGRSGLFDVVLTEIDGQLFMDMFPKPPPDTLNAFYTLHMVPAHTFMQISIGETAVELRLLDFEWLENYLITDPDALEHEKTDQLPVLTAETPEMREFLKKTLAIDGTWSDPLTLLPLELDQLH